MFTNPQLKNLFLAKHKKNCAKVTKKWENDKIAVFG